MLRLPTLADAETIFNLYAQDAQVTRYLTWKPHPDVGTTQTVVQRLITDWGQSIMTEAVRAVIDWVLSQPDIYRVSAICDWENLASARVMEKAGIQREGLLRRGVLHPNISAEPRDCWSYARTK